MQSLIHAFMDSLVHWFIGSLVHCFNDTWGSPFHWWFQWFVVPLPWFIGSLVHCFLASVLQKYRFWNMQIYKHLKIYIFHVCTFAYTKRFTCQKVNISIFKYMRKKIKCIKFKYYIPKNIHVQILIHKNIYIYIILQI